MIAITTSSSISVKPRRMIPLLSSRRRYSGGDLRAGCDLNLVIFSQRLLTHQLSPALAGGMP